MTANVRQSIDTRLWGSSAWTFLYAVAAGFSSAPSDADKTEYRALYGSLAKTLPCTHCRENFAKMIAQRSPNLTSRDTLLEWTLWAREGTERHATHARIRRAPTLREVRNTFLPAPPPPAPTALRSRTTPVVRAKVERAGLAPGAMSRRPWDRRIAQQQRAVGRKRKGGCGCGKH